MRAVPKLLISLYVLSAGLPCGSQTACTNPHAFNAATVGFVEQTTVDFDAQASGTPAVSYGILTLSASGLDSDGTTPITLPTIATDAFPANSGANALGVSGEDHSFLAGNSDRITFSFSSPVNAFGLYIIGNPSPTGEPALPFWRMHVNVSGGFDALSATDPLYTLDPGNDVYFLGVVSPLESFTQVDLYSDNDLAAVYSFNADDLVHAAVPGQATILEAKSVPSEPVLISNAVVTRVHSARFNIETPDRSAGIAVIGDGAIRGNAITLLGTCGATADGERVIDLAQIVQQTSSTAPMPVGMTTLSVGGEASVGLQIGVPGSIGPNNIGLDATIWGTITAIAPDHNWMTVDDGVGRPSGEGYPGVKVVGAINAASRLVGDAVGVTGSISLWLSGRDYYPLIRVAEPGDVVP